MVRPSRGAPPTGAAAALLGLALAPACSGPEPPNVLLVVVDTLRADVVGAYGCPLETTPHLDALASQGRVFEQAYSHSGWTLPSMTSLLTGLLPHEHGVGRDDVERTRFHGLDPAVDTLAERLSAAGYATAAVVNNTFLAPEFALDQGFDAYDYRGASRQEIRSAPETVDAALRWARGRAEPWFLLVHLMEPHLAYDPPPEDLGLFTPPGAPPVEVPFASEETLEGWELGEVVPTREEVAYAFGLYEEEVHAADRAIGRLVDELDARGLGERTLVVVTSDHGEEFFERGAFEHGHALWGLLTRVPLIVRAPGLAPSRVRARTTHQELAEALAAVPREGVRALEGLGAAGSGAPPPLAENCLYGPPRAALTVGDVRLHYELASGRATLWQLDEEGIETQPLTGPEADALREELVSRLRDARGGLGPRTAPGGTRLEDLDVFEELRALGYLGRD